MMNADTEILARFWQEIGKIKFQEFARIYNLLQKEVEEKLLKHPLQ